jgi:hypothetical protein
MTEIALKKLDPEVQRLLGEVVIGLWNIPLEGVKESEEILQRAIVRLEDSLNGKKEEKC